MSFLTEYNARIHYESNNFMPYVPSEKTVPPADDRKILNPLIEACAKEAADDITNNFSLIRVYKSFFLSVAGSINRLLLDGHLPVTPDARTKLAKAIYELGNKWGYEGAFLGELNYACTIFIQLVPLIKVQRGDWKESDELRYWLYASTVEALTFAHDATKTWGIGVSGVFEDVKDEYKVRVNQSYEIAQVLKSGDCYHAPWYSRVAEVVDEDGRNIGYLYVPMKRSEETLNIDLLQYQFVVRKRPSA